MRFIPILSTHQIKPFTLLCGAELPAPLLAKLEKFAHDDAPCADFGVEYATRQWAELLPGAAPGLPFYTLNKARSTLRVARHPGRA